MKLERLRLSDGDAVRSSRPRRTGLLGVGLFAGALATLLTVIGVLDPSASTKARVALALLATTLLAIALRVVTLWRTLPRRVRLECDTVMFEFGRGRVGHVSLSRVRELRSIGWGLAPGILLVDESGRGVRIPYDIQDVESVLERITLASPAATPRYEVPVQIPGLRAGKFVRDLLLSAGLPGGLGLWALLSGELAAAWLLSGLALLTAAVLLFVAYRKPIRIEINGDEFRVAKREAEVRIPFGCVESVRLHVLSLGNASQSGTYVSVVPKEGAALVLRPYGVDPLPLFRVLWTQWRLAQGSVGPSSNAG